MWSITLCTLERTAADGLRPCPAHLRQNLAMPDTSDGDISPSAGPQGETAQAPAARPRGRRRVVVGIALLVVVAGAVWWRQTVMADPNLVFTTFNRVLEAGQQATG